MKSPKSEVLSQRPGVRGRPPGIRKICNWNASIFNLRPLLLGAVLLACGQSALHAQNYSISAFQITTGGGVSAGGAYSVEGAVTHNPAAGQLAGGPYSLTGGFRSLISAVQTPGAPVLYISRSGSIVTVYWQNTPGWSLQQTSSLTLPSNWSPSPGVTASNGTNYLSLAAPAGNLFFRLRQP